MDPLTGNAEFDVYGCLLNPDERKEGVPTPEEIAAMCRMFRESWDDNERRRRAGAYAEELVDFRRTTSFVF